MNEAIRTLIEKWDEAIAMNEQAYRDLPKPLPIPDDLPNDWRTEPAMAGARAGALEGIRVYTRCKTDLRAALLHAGEVPQPANSVKSQAAERLRQFIRSNIAQSHISGCRMLSKGDQCGCLLCAVDALMSGALPPVQPERP